MPGPGPHIMYALTVGTGLMRVSRGSFSPHHCLFYAANAFLGPDLGSFSEWLSSYSGEDRAGRRFGSLAMEIVHHPFYYILLLGFPLSFLYAWLSRVLLQKGLLDTFSGVPLTWVQCLFLVAAGSLSHFFLDHLFEENGHSSMYMWILSTGWWESRAPINPDSVLIIGFLCSFLLGGFIYINRLKIGVSITSKANQSFKLILVVACCYSLWCAVQIYLRNPPQPAVGEEADLGVLVFLGVYFFLPHGFCILSMNQKGHGNELPL
ncbi:hypothetical protein HPP92_018575 [Vanilla planifolia]|uniref:Uncharacterized protein n=1 Tax=Vanilla planifolia TaxID=51239 RepID=A0A835Q739_VANPL|nr:hypothetical protein HPP92_019181 [Vanilla planifolia]KAG0469247.1 hypothetical protein HPP92_018575 [Vanilla planifolia]